MFCSNCGKQTAETSQSPESRIPVSTPPVDDRGGLDATGWVLLIATVALMGAIIVGFIQAGFSQEAEPKSTISPVRGPCETTFARASMNTDSSDAEILLVETLTDCESIDEWWVAANRFPTAFGAYDILGTELDLMCDRYPQVGICSKE